MKPYNPKNFLVLVVDDVRQNLILLSNILEDAGYNTTFANSGNQGLERAKLAKPDLILLDLMMPDIDGLKVCQLIKADPNLAETPIIFLTASNDKEHLIEAFSQGAVDYITKPFNKFELLARVKTHLQLKDTEKQLKQALSELEQLVKIDFLTGIYNRRSFFLLAQEEFKRSRQELNDFSILMLDIDHFKKINDIYSHVVGDRVLKNFVEIIKKNKETEGYFARFGGEEFIMLLPKTNIDKATTIAENLRKKVAKETLIVDDFVIDITVSIGGATYCHDDKSVEMIIQRADHALYEAKKTGRNRVCFA